jgi:hyperosmotically inducible protein
MFAILRLLIIVVVLLVVGSFLMGYWGGQRFTLGGPQRVETRADERAATSDTVQRARERGAEIGEKAAVATSEVKETVNEAALTAKIKAKMTLDDLVKARTIDVTTHGTTVTLSGTVQSRAEHDRAMSLARETATVTQVIDDLHLP